MFGTLGKGRQAAPGVGFTNRPTLRLTAKAVEILNALSCVAHRETGPIFNPSVGLPPFCLGHAASQEAESEETRTQLYAYSSLSFWTPTKLRVRELTRGIASSVLFSGAFHSVLA